MWRCLVFVVAVSIWNLEVEAVPQGDNTCQGVVKHPVKVKVNVTEPVTFRTYTWCLRVPPRCSKYVVQMRERVKEQIELHNRTITVCCRGYVEMESKCVPACPPMTECPFMHCNRTNHCYCSPGYSGIFCNDPCPKGVWGKDCKKPCDCPDGFTCHHLTGDCMLDDKPSIKTTVRRAFTHISSESAPVTLRTVISTTERNTMTSTPSTTIKTTSMTSRATSQVMTNKPFIPEIEKSFVSTEEPSMKNSVTPPILRTSFPVIITSTFPSTVSTPSINSLPVTTSPTTQNPTVLTVKEPVTAKPVAKLPSTENNIIHITPSSFFRPTPKHSTFLPPLDLRPISSDTLTRSLSTETTSVEETSYLPDFAGTPQSNVHMGKNPDKSGNNLQFKEDFSNNKEIVTTEKLEISSLEPVTTPDLSDLTTSKLSIFNNHGIPKAVTQTTHLFKANTEPHFNYGTKPTVLKASETSNHFEHIPATTLTPTFSSAPHLPQLVISSTLRAVPEYDETSTESLFDENNGPILPTGLSTAHFYNLPVTNTVDVPLAPMQTPNRNWNPFIPSPVSTKSDVGLTIPFSVNSSELTTTFKTDANLDFTAKTQQLDLWNVKDATPFSARPLGSTSTSSPTNTFNANTFLHSFLPARENADHFSEKNPSSAMPGYLNPDFISTSTKKPYTVTYPVLEESNTFSNEEKYDTSMAEAPMISTGKYHNEDNLQTASENVEDKGFTAYISKTNFEIEPVTLVSTSTHAINLLINSAARSTTSSPVRTKSTFQTSHEIATSTAAMEEFNAHYQTTTKASENSYTDASREKPIQFTSQGVVNTLAKSVDSAGTKKDESLKPTLFYTDKFHPKIITAERGESADPGNVESVNILAKNEFISLIKTKQAVKSFSEIGTTEGEKEKPQIKEIITESNLAPSTYSIYDKIITASEAPEPIFDLSTDKGDSATIHYSIPFDKVLDSTPIMPNEINSIANGKLLEEPSNYLPTLNEKSTLASGYLGYVSKGEIMKSTKENSVTQPPQLGYLPTNKDFLNLTYILNSINDFTSKSRRGMKQSISSMYGHSSRVKMTGPPPLKELVTNAVNDREPSTEVFKTVSVQPNKKPERNSGSRPHREKHTSNDSKIIHLNISRHAPFINPTSKFVPKYSSAGFKNLVATYSNDHDFMTTPIDGRITTVSILSTVPDLKYQAKRSTKEYYQKTDNAFTLKVPLEEAVSGVSPLTTNHMIKDAIYTTIVTPASVSVTPIPMKPFPVNEEVSKKPFRRKDDFSTYDELEDVGPNMTAALAAHSSGKEAHISLMTGILATIVCIVLLGSLVSAIVFFIYCKKEKPVPMESCIMAYEQNDSTDPSSIYSVPRPSLSPEIFFCPTFSHHYAAQINKELRELSYGSTKQEKSEPFYTEISIETTSA